MSNDVRNMILRLILKELLRAKDMTVADLSNRTEVPVNTLHNWLAGQNPRNVVQLKRVADYFGVTVDYLLFGNSRTLDTNKMSEILLKGHFELIIRPIKQGDNS